MTDGNRSKGLRQQAELALEQAPRPVSALAMARDTERLIHELQVHQVELEMQNDELVRSHEELQRSHDRYLDLYDSAPVGYVSLDRRGYITEANLTAAAMLGLERDRLLGRPLAAFCVEPSADALYLHSRKVLEEGGTHTCEIEVRTGSGALLDLRLESRPDATKTHCTMALIDITERKRAQSELKRTLEELEARVTERTQELSAANEALAVSEERFRLLAENAPDVIYRIRLTPRPSYEYLSPSILALTGCAPEEFYEDAVLGVRVVHPEDRPLAERELGPGATLDKPVELRIAGNDGTWRWVEFLSSGVFDENGNLVAIEGVSRDITERKHAEEALHVARDTLEKQVQERTAHLARANETLTEVERELRKREASLRSILETAIDGIISIDEQGRIESFNLAAERIFGYETAEVLGQNFTMLMSPEYAAEHDSDFRRYLETGEKKNVGTGREVVGRRKHGSLFPMDLGIGAMHGEPRRLTGIVRDATARRRLEAELRQSQKMEAIGTLASGVAHDFNNLLMGLIGCAELALSKLPDRSPAERYLEALKSAAYSGAGIVAQLLEASRPRADKLRVVDLNTLLSNREILIGRLIREDVELRIVLGCATACVRCDPAQLEQVLMNLIVNARHAMPHGGRLTISTGELSVRPHDPSWKGKLAAGDYVILAVQDTGVGMDEETQRRAFEPFFTTKEPGKGTGLGLSTVYAIVTACGGHMAVESRPNIGTIFTLYLPRAEGSVSDEPEPVSLGAERGGETVLVVEDEPLVQIAVCHYLERHGYQVLEAPTLEAADEVLADLSVPIDLLLTDVVLPRTSGRKIAELGRSHRPELRVLFMSANSAKRLIMEGRLEEGSVSLQKPFTESELLAMVRGVLPRTTRPPPPPGSQEVLEVKARATDVQAFQSHHPPTDESADNRVKGGEVRPNVRPSLTRRPCLLVVEDNDLARETVTELLEDDGYRVVATASGGEALRAWAEQDGGFDAILSDINLPDMSGLRLVERVREERPTVALVVMTGRSVSDPMFDGVRDDPRTMLLEKPVDIVRLSDSLRKLLEKHPQPD